MSKLKKIADLETKYPVNEISFKGLSVWVVIRLYYSYLLSGKTPVKGSIFLSIKKLSYIFYGFFNYFGKYDFIAFTNASERKLIHNMMYDRLDFLPKTYKTLYFELPIPKHYHRKKIPTRYIVSKLPIYGLVWVISKLIFGKINPSSLWLLIKKEGDIDFNEYQTVKRYYAQFLVGKFLYFLYKPKIFFVTPSFTNMGFIRAFKEKGTKVIEMQHGIINKEHIAYNYQNKVNNLSFPDYLFSFGLHEKDTFENNYFIAKSHVLPTGHFYLDWLKENFKPNPKILDILKHYNTSVTFTAQVIYDKAIIPLLFQIAKKNKDTVFLYVPRVKKNKYDELIGKPDNIIIVDYIDCYNTIMHTDFHSTIYSTCALEAPVLGKQNILIDFKGLSTKYYKNVLNDKNVTLFIKTDNEFSYAIQNMHKIPCEEIIKRSNKIIISGFKKNLKENLQIILNEIFEK